MHLSSGIAARKVRGLWLVLMSALSTLSVFLNFFGFQSDIMPSNDVDNSHSGSTSCAGKPWKVDSTNGRCYKPLFYKRTLFYKRIFLYCSDL